MIFSDRLPYVLVTRPPEQANATAARLRAEGWCAPLVAPVLRIEPVAWELPQEAPVAVVITSGNAVPALALLPRAWPVYAVGTATAAAVRAMGFDTVHDAAGDMVALGSLIRRTLTPEAGTLLYLSGATITTDPSAILPAYHVVRRIVYAATPLTRLPEGAEAASCALLYSPRSAALFANLFPHRDLTPVCLSPSVARAAGTGWRDLRIAQHPDEEHLFAALRNHLVRPDT